ncbi:bud neck involved protein [Coemansia brasiliensis]|uniref:Bud neck involved protein n=1 Tax=Coemansia brasiliensis TaxID=2650707 RepID=A0A9W8I8I0_9FUNG|nr:bud neck involved protein [Coemansia brasiliensis]
MFPNTTQSSKQSSHAGKHGNSRGKPAAKTLGIRNRLSLPVTQRLQRKSTVRCADAEYDISELPEILEFRLTSPIPSPVPALTPPPTFEADKENENISDTSMVSFLSGVKSTEPLQNPFISDSKQTANGKNKRSYRSKQRPPLRKRSLIYAMYCTTQPEDATNHQRLSSIGSIISANNGSATFVSCTSMPSINDSQESVVNPCQPVVASGQYSQSQQTSDMSIGFMLVDAVEHLASIRRREGSDAASDAESVSSSSSSSSRYVCAEHTIIDTNAYRCSSKHAPRLSTIERSQDGRLLLKPTISTSANPTDSGHTSTADASPKASEEPTSPSISNYIHRTCLENFPPFPDISPRRRAAREPVNSLLIHASKLEVEAVRASRPCENTIIINGVSSELCCEPLPTDALHTAATPPDSPTQESVVSGDVSEGTAVFTAGNAGNNSEATTACSKADGQSGQCSEKSIHSSSSSVNSETIDSSGVDMPASCSETHFDCHKATSTTADELAPPPACSQPAREDLQKTCQDCSYDSITQLTDSTCRDSNLCSMFSDVSDIDLRSLGLLDLSHASSGPWTDQSLLFSGSQVSTPRPRSLTLNEAPIPPQLDTCRRHSSNNSLNPNELDDIPLAQVAYMTSKSTQQPLASPHESKARRLTSVLAKAAQLDGLRHFHRKSRSTDRWSHSPPALRRYSGSSNGSGSSGKQHNEVMRDGGLQPSSSKGSPKKLFRFNELVAVYETWNRDEYDRRGMPATRLDADLIEQIKQELNEYKTYEMPVHEASRQYTHFIC